MTVLFVHGALVGDSQWWWHRMAEPLARRGLSAGAVVLPSCEGAPGELGDMYADAAAVSAAVAAITQLPRELNQFLCSGPHRQFLPADRRLREYAAAPRPSRHRQAPAPRPRSRVHLPHWDAPEATVRLILDSTA